MDARDTPIAAVAIPTSEVNMIEIVKSLVSIFARRSRYPHARGVDDVKPAYRRGRLLALSVPAAQESTLKLRVLLNALTRPSQGRVNVNGGNSRWTEKALRRKCAAAYWYDFPAF